MPDPNQNSTPRWYTVDEAAIYLRCSPQTVRSLIHQQQLRAASLGNSFRLDINDLDQFLLRRKKAVAPYRRGSHPWVAARWARRRRKKSR